MPNSNTNLEAALRIKVQTEGRDQVDGLGKSLDELGNKTLQDLEAELNALALSLGKDKEQAEQAGSAINELGAGSTGQDLKDLTSDLNKLSTALEKDTEQAQETAQSLEQLGAGSGKNLRVLQTDLEKVDAALSRDKVEARTAQELLSRLGLGADKNLQALEAELNALAADIHQSGLESQTTSSKLRGIGDAADAAAGRAVPAAGRIRDGVESISLKLSDLQKAVLAYLGVTNFGPMLKGLGATADEYQNLSARIRLVTNDEAAFQSALAGVERVALQTNSSLSSTGDLFTKILTAGKSLKLSQQDALALTQSINQAIQVSGASAASADAATVQLIQGLQSGVLRGEEFNSVMEQSPRLARALADGLGVTTGKLREMANAGQLTSETVIAALQSQGRVIEQEYSKMPATIGRALSNLSSQWTIFIGEADKGAEVSQKAAWAINLLSNNLDKVAGGLLAAGKAWLAYRAWNIADEFLLISKAAQTAALGKAQDTAATVANTTATAANTAAQVANANARAASAAAAANVTGAVGKLGAALSLVKGFSWAFLLTNLPEIGEWLGKTAAQLMGYGKIIEDNERRQRAMEEADRAAAQAKAELAAKTKAAEEASLGLNDQSRALIASFEADTKAGKSTTEAIDELAKAMQLGDKKGIADAGAALDALGKRGILSADQIQTAWAKALQGKDLQIFLTTAQAAFDQTEQGARRMAAATEGAVDQALLATGKDMSELTTGVSKAARSAINNVDLLASSVEELRSRGVKVGPALEASLDKALAAANTEDAVKEVIKRFEELGKQGLITGDQLREGLDKGTKKLDELKNGINSVGEAARLLGVKSKAELQRLADDARVSFEMLSKSGLYSTDQLSKAFANYAEKAIAANGGVASEALIIQGQMRGVVIETDAAGKAVVKLANATKDLRDQQQRSDKPTGMQIKSPGGLSNPADLPNGLSASDLQQRGLTQKEIEDYQLNRDPNAPPGTRRGYQYSQSIDPADVARKAGLRGDDVQRFAAQFSAQLADKMADLQDRMRQDPLGMSAEVYRNLSDSAYAEAVQATKDAIRQSNGTQSDSANNNTSNGGNSSGNFVTPSKIVRVELKSPSGKAATAHFGDETQANAFLDLLKQHAEVAR